MARRKKDKGADVSVLADMPRVLADVAGMTFDPTDGAYVSQLNYMTIYCDVGMVLKNDDDEVVLDIYTADGISTGLFYDWYYLDNKNDGTINDEGNYTSIKLWVLNSNFRKSPITEEGTYIIKTDPSFPIVLANGSVVDDITLTYIVGEKPAMVTIPLTDLDGNVTGSAYVTPVEGAGDGAVSVTADADNEGLDRSGVVTFHTTSGAISVARTIVQEGLREPFAGSDGDFIVADGGTFHVLK